MNKTALKGALISAVIVTTALAAGHAVADGSLGTAPAGGHDAERRYAVTIRVATRGQPIAPSVFVTHDRRVSIFEVGPADEADPGYEGLAILAETGAPDALADALAGVPGVDSVTVLLAPTHPAPPVLMPGESNGTVVTASKNKRFFSAVGMLAATNDAFYAVRGVPLPRKGSITVYGAVYDAGSEPNTELLADIPAGGNGAYNSPDEPGEGHIHVHAGIHGTGTLDPATHDWRNPAVEITITRLAD
ncbi:MAG: spondin domain-containing protein [Rhodospirillales bacterium]|nr:MAG: spondin domain-containing protein [Rhodospirillales bacterium]